MDDSPRTRYPISAKESPPPFPLRCRTIRVERPRDPRLQEPRTLTAVRSNGWLDDPRTESGTTGLWKLDWPHNPARSGRGWLGTPQRRSGVEHARGLMAGWPAGQLP
jgi:hypothetical protein